MVSFPCLQQIGVKFFKTFLSVVNVCTQAEMMQKKNDNNAAAYAGQSNAFGTFDVLRPKKVAAVAQNLWFTHPHMSVPQSETGAVLSAARFCCPLLMVCVC